MTPSTLLKGAIDCDVHPAVSELTDLIPYMDEYWADQFTMRGIDGLESVSYPPNAPLTCRSDWRRAGIRPGSSCEHMKADLLDAFGLSTAMLNCLYPGVSAMSDQMAAAIARAVNDWLIDRWLDKDQRFGASIIVAPQNPRLAAEEIERRASDRRFHQVLVLVGQETPLGREHYWPIFEAAHRYGLPVGIHAGTMNRQATTPNGWPSHYMHDYVANAHVFAAQLHSLVCGGIFGKFPELKVVLIESGVSWLPPFLWRVTKNWKGLRGEIPWVKNSPSEIVRHHVRLTAQPFDCPGDPASVERLCEQIGSDEMLMFASDYPHWQFDGFDALPAGMNEGLRRKIVLENPLKIYTRLQETVK